MHKVLIRPLQKNDALISWHWRNDPEVWRYTGNRPDKYITYEIEKQWIEKALLDNLSKRFAILVDNEYVGNIQLTNIKDFRSAQYHIFIGNKNFWGRRVAHLATRQILYYAKEVLKLETIYLYVNQRNKTGISVYEKNGFVKEQLNEDIRMSCSLDQLKPPNVSVFVMVYNHENYIREALDGMLMQKCNFDFNIVIGEDCSNDNSRKIIMEYADLYPGKFKLLLHEHNVGAVANQTAVLQCCTGKYIALCEGDDYWTDPLKLQKQIDLLESNPEIIACFTNAEYRNEIIDKKHLYVQHLKEGIVNTDTIIQFGGSLYPTASLMFHKERLNLEHFIQLKDDFSGGDELLIYLLMNEGKIYFIDQITCIYRRWIGGVYSSIINDTSALVQCKKQNIKGFNKFNTFAKYKFKKSIKRKISSSSIYILKNDAGFSKLKYIFHLHYKDFFKLIFRL